MNQRPTGLNVTKAITFHVGELGIQFEQPHEKHSAKLADISEKALRQVKTTVPRLLVESMNMEKAGQLATKLLRGIWTHDYPISVESCRFEFRRSSHSLLVYFIMVIFCFSRHT